VINIVVPMAGKGLRINSSENLPKPLISVNGLTMIERVIESLGIPGHYIFIILKSSNNTINNELKKILLGINTIKTTIIEIDSITKRPACSALIAEKLINTNSPLIIANCDQIMNWDAVKFKNYIKSTVKDGVVVTFTSKTPKNSYIKLNKDGNAIELAEKKVISNHSLNGIHFWKKGCLFVSSAKEMISSGTKIKNEYYIAPSYNILIKKGF
jgi:NDP-sugar pyrophosphorylase family protein